MEKTCTNCKFGLHSFREEPCKSCFEAQNRCAWERKERPVVSRVRVYGLEDSVAASKYPMAVDVNKCTSLITNNVRKLASCATGTGHDNFLNGIVVQFDLTFSIKAWVEAERYHFLDFVSSQSTMHRIAQFDPEQQCNEYVQEDIIRAVKALVDEYNAKPTPEKYLRLLYNVPVGFMLTARMTTNYRQLKTIYQQRRTHRLPEWRKFCAWVETLPHSYLITGKDGEDEQGNTGAESS